MKRKIIEIDTVACLKNKYSNFEIHLKNENPRWWYRGIFPLNSFQIFLWWMLGFKYICGVDYIDLMARRAKEGKL